MLAHDLSSIRPSSHGSLRLVHECDAPGSGRRLVVSDRDSVFRSALGAEALVVSRHTNEDELLALEPEWRVLERQSGNTLPFRTATWTRAWWAHLRQSRASLRDRLELRTLRTRAGELIGVAPLMLTERPGTGLIRSRCLQFIGADPNVTELRGPLWAPEHAAACWKALESHVLEARSEWDWVLWSGLPCMADERQALAPKAWGREIPYYTLLLDGNWPSFRSGLGRNIKESLRKCYNSLKRDGLSPSLHVASEGRELERALDDFFRLHSARAQLRGTTEHADLFREPARRAFLRDVCRGLANEGRTRIFRLVVGERVVAARVGFAIADTLYLYYSGYEPEFAKYSVMTTTVSEVIQYAFAQGFRHINLSTGNDPSKHRWGPTESTEREAVTVSPTARGRLTYGALQLVHESPALAGAFRRALSYVGRPQ